MKVAVFNDNIYPYKETFRDKAYEIPAKGHIELEEGEAKLLLRSMNSVLLNADGQPLPESYKKLRILRNRNELPSSKQEAFTCHSCAKEFSSQEMLDDHILENHLEQIDADEDTKKDIKDKLSKKKSPSL